MDATKGLSCQEIISRVQSYVGDTSANFLEYLQQSIGMAQYRFCKAHDWYFLQRSDLIVSVDGTKGVNEYDLAQITDSITGQTVQVFTGDISMIHMVYPGIVLRKISIQDLRRFDPQETNGSIADNPSMWCPISDTRFKIWPDTFGGGAVVTFINGLGNTAQNLITGISSMSPTTIISNSHFQSGGAGKNEIQILKFDVVPLSGTFTLTLDANTTAPIAYNASANDIQLALEALPNIGTGNITVDSNPVAGSMSLDCKISPLMILDTDVTVGSSALYSLIPAKYQESFTRYMIALGLDYIDDSRADQKKQEALEDIKADVRDDLSMRADVDLPRIRAMFEARLDGAGANLNALLFGFLAPYD